MNGSTLTDSSISGRINTSVTSIVDQELGKKGIWIDGDLNKYLTTAGIYFGSKGRHDRISAEYLPEEIEGPNILTDAAYETFVHGVKSYVYGGGIREHLLSIFYNDESQSLEMGDIVQGQDDSVLSERATSRSDNSKRIVVADAHNHPFDVAMSVSDIGSILVGTAAASVVICPSSIWVAIPTVQTPILENEQVKNWNTVQRRQILNSLDATFTDDSQLSPHLLSSILSRTSEIAMINMAHSNRIAIYHCPTIPTEVVKSELSTEIEKPKLRRVV